MKIYSHRKPLAALLLSMFLTLVAPFSSGQTYIPTHSAPAVPGHSKPVTVAHAICLKKTLDSWGYKFEENDQLKESKPLIDGNCFQGPFVDSWVPHNKMLLPKNLMQALLELSQNHEITQTADPELVAALNYALTHKGAQCVFQKNLSSATRNAANALSNNWHYVFAVNGDVVDSLKGFVDGDLHLELISGWQALACPVSPDNTNPSAKCFAPQAGSIHAALTNLDTGYFSSQCFSGLEIAQYSAINRLFGERIEKSFPNPESFFVSDPEVAVISQSVVQGASINAIRDDYGLQRANLGQEAFVGAGGVIINVHEHDTDHGARFLKDPVNNGENFMITHMSAAANAALKASPEGTKSYTQLLKEIWQLGTTAEVTNKGFLEKIQDRMSRGESLIQVSDSFTANERKFINDLNEPFLRDTILYVKGGDLLKNRQRSIAFHLVRLAIKNPQTPYQILFYPDTLHYEVFNRWVDSQVKSQPGCEL